MRITEGRLVERPCPDCGGTERRAFGEAEAPRGELASYAIGWTSGHDDAVAHMTIGIGAGNPGGGSFHIEIHPHEDSWGMGLVDRPFEDVPEGGPDLSREEALAHPDLRFIWYVADNVMAQDRRAWWLTHWLLGTRAFVMAAIVEGAAPIVHVVRDGDGDWQLLSGSPADDEDPRPAHLFHAIDADPSLLDVLDLEPGQRADRDAPGSPWERSSA